jgi:hypothetical protein
MVRAKEGIFMARHLFLLIIPLLLSGCTLPGNPAASSSVRYSEETIPISSVPVSSEANFDYGENYIVSHLGTTYWISYSYTTKTNGVADEPFLITSARNDKGYYIKDNAGTEALFLKDGMDFVVYMPNEQGVLTLVPDLRVDEANVQGYTTSLLGFMSIYEVAKDDLEKEGEETVAGRPAWKYVFHSSFTTSAIDLHYSIDKATGVCLRYQSQVIQGRDTSAFEFICTVFKDRDVALPLPQ